MAYPQYPKNPTLNQEFTVGDLRFYWDGEKWKALTSADKSLRNELVQGTANMGGITTGNLVPVLSPYITLSGYFAWLESLFQGVEVTKLTSKRFVGTASDDGGSPDGVYVVNRTHAGPNSPHSFKDNTIWQPPSDGTLWAYAAYDAYGQIYDNVNTDHVIDYQSRARKYGSGTVDEFTGFGCVMRVDLGHVNKFKGFINKGAIYTDATCGSYDSFESVPSVHGSATSVVHFHARDVNGIPGSTLGSQVGFYCRSLAKAPPSTSWPILVDPQPVGVKNLIQCYTHFTQQVHTGAIGSSLSGIISVYSSGASFARNFDAITNTTPVAGVAVQMLHQNDGTLFRFSPSVGAGATPAFVDLLKIKSNGELELYAVGASIVSKSPDGTKYKLTAPNGGGAATWAVY